MAAKWPATIRYRDTGQTEEKALVFATTLIQTESEDITPENFREMVSQLEKLRNDRINNTNTHSFRVGQRPYDVLRYLSEQPSKAVLQGPKGLSEITLRQE